MNVNYPVAVAAPPVATGPTRKFPPVVLISCAALVCVVTGGIVMASYVPRRPPLAVPSLLLALAVVLLLADFVLLARLRNFAWQKFFLVGRWALLAYIITSGMIEFAFVRNHTRGAPLGIVTAMLVVFALCVPLNIAFTVARYASE